MTMACIFKDTPSPLRPPSFPSPLPFLTARPPQIANVGFLDVDNRTVGHAVASDTLFIHGSLTGGGGTQFLAKKSSKENNALQRRSGGGDGEDEVCKAPCGTTNAVLGIDGTSTVCDNSCDPTGPYGARFDGRFCGAGNATIFGSHCRVCFYELEAARRSELALQGGNDSPDAAQEQHVIMCESLRPPEAADCSIKCAMKTDTVSVRFMSLYWDTTKCFPRERAGCPMVV